MKRICIRHLCKVTCQLSNIATYTWNVQTLTNQTMHCNKIDKRSPIVSGSMKQIANIYIYTHNVMYVHVQCICFCSYSWADYECVRLFKINEYKKKAVKWRQRDPMFNYTQHTHTTHIFGYACTAEYIWRGKRNTLFTGLIICDTLQTISRSSLKCAACVVYTLHTVLTVYVAMWHRREVSVRFSGL